MKKLAERPVSLTVKKLTNHFQRYMNGIKADMVAKIDDAESVTELQGTIVSYLYEEIQRNGQDEVYQKDVEKQFNIRRSTATMILKRMEKNGLIIRKVSSSDARMKSITLTPKSREMYPIAHAELMKYELQAVKGITEEELAVFFRVVDKLIANIS